MFEAKYFNYKIGPNRFFCGHAESVHGLSFYIFTVLNLYMGLGDEASEEEVRKSIAVKKDPPKVSKTAAKAKVDKPVQETPVKDGKRCAKPPNNPEATPEVPNSSTPIIKPEEKRQRHRGKQQDPNPDFQIQSLKEAWCWLFFLGSKTLR